MFGFELVILQVRTVEPLLTRFPALSCLLAAFFSDSSLSRIPITMATLIRSFWGYADKTDHGQNGPDKTDHVSGQNGPRLRTKRTTFQDKTDQASGQKDHVSGKKRALFYLGQTGQCKKIDDVLQRSKESSQYCVSS